MFESNKNQFLTQKNVSLKWCGFYRNYPNSMAKQINFTLQKNHILYTIEILVQCNKKTINIRASEPVYRETLLNYLDDIRRFDYLVDGTFYRTEKCEADTSDITKRITGYELSYFSCSKDNCKIPLEFSDKDYKHFFLKWIKVQSEFWLINQVSLFASCSNGLPADVRVSMLAECFEGLGKYPKCQEHFELKLPNKKSFANYLNAFIETYGKSIFSNEYRRRKTLIQKIVGTRNKVFHVYDRKKKTLKGEQCGVYAIKLEYLLRYILLLEIGISKDKLDLTIGKVIAEFDNKFQNYLY